MMKKTVSKVKKMYSVISQTVKEYQFENQCNDNVSDCFEAGDSYVNSALTKRLAEKFSYTNEICSADICTKDNCPPAAYVLKHGKLPPL